jgi:thioredoxin-dependent peroxiredoxin
MLNQVIPEFELPSTSGKIFKLSEHAGKTIALYFYPKDATPGCTTQGQQFRDHYAEFEKLRVAVYGISRDSLKSHENFKAKFNFPFELLSDSEELACQLFGVIKMKKMYGKEVRGIERSTFIIDGKGVVIKEWRGVKVDGHVSAVLDAIQSLG